jgi:hypothetical protein
MSESWFLGLKPQVMRLSGPDSAAFAEALLDPPEPSEHLVEAMRRHRAVLGNILLTTDGSESEDQGKQRALQ